MIQVDLPSTNKAGEWLARRMRREIGRKEWHGPTGLPPPYCRRCGGRMAVLASLGDYLQAICVDCKEEWRLLGLAHRVRWERVAVGRDARPAAARLRALRTRIEWANFTLWVVESYWRFP